MVEIEQISLISVRFISLFLIMSYWRDSPGFSVLLLVSLMVVQANTFQSGRRIDLSDKPCFSSNHVKFSPATLKQVVSVDNLVVRTPVFLLEVETKSLNRVPIPFSTSTNHVPKWRIVYTGLILLIRVLRI